MAHGVKVQRIETIPIALPLRREWKWRGLAGDIGRWVIVRVLTDHEGLVGLGEAAALPDWGGDDNRYAGETQETVAHVCDQVLAPAVAGASPFDIQRVIRAMDDALSGHTYAKSAVEMALFDLQGKITGQPVHNLIGGRVREGVELAHMIGIMDADAALAEGTAAVEEGCRAFQIKGTGDLERDLDVLRLLRESLGHGVMLRFDANQGYRHSGPRGALHAARALAAAGVDLLEQPTEGLSQMARVCRESPVPIIADESAWQPRDVLELERAGAVDAISIYVSKSGGLERSRQIALLAEHLDLPCDVNGSFESGIGTAANMHLAVALPAISLPAVISATAPAGTAATATVGRYYTDDIVTEAFPYSAGRLFPPEGPGLGVTVDEERLRRYRLDT